MQASATATYPQPAHNLGIAYLLALGGFMGIAGIHRFYLGKPFTGLIWFMTGGLMGLGTIYDLVTMEDQVNWANRKALPGGYRALPPPRPVYYQRPQQAYAAHPASAYLRNPHVSLEQRMLHLARLRGGRLTIPMAASELGCTVEDAEKQLTELAANDHATTDITEDGALVFDFPTLRAA